MIDRRRPGAAAVAAALAVGTALAVAALLAGCGAPARTRSAGSTPGTSGLPAGDPSPSRPAASGAGPSSSRTPAATPSQQGEATPVASPPTGSPLPSFRHVYLLVMENEGYGSIVGSPAAPYLNRLIARYGLATAYEAVAHPSQPNYIALLSGSTQGVADDGVHDVGAASLLDQIDAHGRTWRVFAQNVPPGCFTGEAASDGADGAGTYARKHEPAISFDAIASDPARCARITDFSHFDPAAADFELIVPNMCNNMHDCPVATGDAFLASFVPRITSSPAFADSVLFITWDEGADSGSGGGRVPLVIVSPLVAAGTVSSVAHDHYSLLRTIEDAWGLGCLERACSANDLRELFGR